MGGDSLAYEKGDIDSLAYQTSIGQIECRT